MTSDPKPTPRRISLGDISIAEPPAPKPGRDPGDDEIGMLVLVIVETRALSMGKIETKVLESPPLKRRYLPWVQDLFRRIHEAEYAQIPQAKIDAALERMMRTPERPAEK